MQNLNTKEIFTEIDQWTQQLIDDINFVEDATSGAVTRSTSKTKRRKDIFKRAKEIERNIHCLIRRYCDNKTPVFRGPAYTLNKPKFDKCLMTAQGYDNLFQMTNINRVIWMYQKSGHLCFKWIRSQI